MTLQEFNTRFVRDHASMVSAIMSLYVVTQSTCESKTVIKPWALALVRFETDLYVHANMSSFYEE